MSYRTTDVVVKRLLARRYDINRNPDLLDALDAANSLTTDVAALAASSKGVILPAGKLELIERWLAAHFYQMSDPGYASESTAGASVSYQGQTGMYLELTRYGQMAMTLDTSGTLAALNKRQIADCNWGGKTEPEQLTYDERN